LFAIVFGDPDQLEALRVFVAAEPGCERWKAITAICTFCIGYFAFFRLESIMDRVSRPSLILWHRSSG
jgi:hypothetical protein